MPDLNQHLQTITVLMVDTVGSTALASSIGHERAERLIAEQLDCIGAVATAHRGVGMSKLGDGLMVGFASAVAALDAAAEMHRAVATLNIDRQVPVPLLIRISAAVSDVALDDQINGAAPVHAARAEKLVPAGQTWCTEAVRLLSRGRAAYDFESMGPHTFKGVDEPVVLHRVRVTAGDLLGMPPLLDSTRRFRFVGRRHETDRLSAAWDGARRGRGHVVAIAGAAGLGKTRLCREFALDVRSHGAVVLHGRCTEEPGEPFAPFAQMLRAVAVHESAARDMLGDGAAELARLVPEVASGILGLAPPSDVDAETDRRRLFDAVISWFGALSARTPLLAVIDDVQWADEPTTQLLRHLADRVGTQHVLILAPYRPTDMGAAVQRLLRQHDAIDQLRLGGLEPDDVAVFAESILGGHLDDPGRSRLAVIGDHVGGNPLYLGEIVPALVDDNVLVQAPDQRWSAGPRTTARTPAAVEDMIRQRVDLLSGPCRRVLDTAAVIGFQFSTELLFAVTGLAARDAAAALDEATAADIVHLEGNESTFEFTHAVMRQAIYEGISPLRRAAEHHVIGEAIESLVGSTPDRWVDQLAYHFENGLGWTDTERAVAALRRAGAIASERLGYEQAASSYQRALTLIDSGPVAPNSTLRCDILIELGTAQRRSGSHLARETLGAAAECAFTLGDARRATVAVLGGGRGVFSIAGSIDADRVDGLRRTLELVGPEPTVARAQLLATLSTELTFDDDPGTAERASDEALAIARELADPGLTVTVLGNRLVALWRADRIEERLAIAQELEAVCHRAGDARRGKFLSAMTTCCQAAMEAGDFATADRRLAWIDETAQTLHQPTSVAYVKLRMASRACLAGRLDDAELLAEEARRLSTVAGMPDASEFFVGQIFTIRFHQGLTGDVVDDLAAAASNFPGIVALAAGVATCAAELDDHDRCADVAQPIIEALDELRGDLNWLTTLALTSNAIRYLGAVDAASRVRQMIDPYRRYFVDNASAFLGSVHHYDGLLASVVGDERGADESFRAAIDAHTRLGSPPWLARTHLEYAEALVRRAPTDGQARAIREHASSAHAIGVQFGLGAVVDRSLRLVPDFAPGSTAL